MEFQKQVRIGAILSYLSISINIIAGLIYTPWMIEQVGQSDYGLYTLSNSLITLFLVDFGLGSATSRYIAKYRAEGTQEKIDSFVGTIYKLYFWIDAVICMALLFVYFLIDEIYTSLTVAELQKFKVVYAVTALFSVTNFPFITLNGILSAYEQFIQLKLADVIYRILLVACTVAALLAGNGLYALVVVHAVVGLLVTAYKYIAVRRYTPVKVSVQNNDPTIYKEIFTFSAWITVAMLAQRLVFNITPSILGAVASSGAIAVFGVVTTIEGYAYTITNAISGMFLPKISRIYQQDDAGKNIMPIFIRVGKFQFVLNGLIVVGFSVIGRQFISLWMGDTYLEAYCGILLVLIPGLFFNSLQIGNTAMIVQNKVNLQAIINVITGVTNVALSIPLSSRYGVLGACASIFIAYMFRALLMNWICWKIMRFDMITFAKKCYFRMTVPILCTLVCGVVVNRIWEAGSWLSLIGKGTVVAGAYGIAIVLFGLEKHEREKCYLIVQNLLQRIIRK